MPLSRTSTLIAALALAGCPRPAAEPDKPGPKTPTALGRLMVEQVNPTFSKLTFLVFHGDTLDDPVALEAELQRNAATLKAATARVRTWPDPPVTTPEAREVFYALSTSADQFAGRLVESLGRWDLATAQTQLEQIAKACNDCHHFFRLKLEDSVVGPSTQPPVGP